jgi:hypothetical protein
MAKTPVGYPEGGKKYKGPPENVGQDPRANIVTNAFVPGQKIDKGTLPIIVLAWSVWTEDPEAMAKIDVFFEYFSNLPKWFTNLWILVVASVFGIKGTQIFRGGKK